MSGFDPTDDELREFADHADEWLTVSTVADLARLVLRERESAATVAAVLRSQTDNMIATEKLADGLAARRDQERVRAGQAEAELDTALRRKDACVAEIRRLQVALGRVEALCEQAEAAPNPYADQGAVPQVDVRDIRAAIAGDRPPPAAYTLDDVWAAMRDPDTLLTVEEKAALTVHLEILAKQRRRVEAEHRDDVLAGDPPAAGYGAGMGTNVEDEPPAAGARPHPCDDTCVKRDQGLNRSRCMDTCELDDDPPGRELHARLRGDGPPPAAHEFRPWLFTAHRQLDCLSCRKPAEDPVHQVAAARSSTPPAQIAHSPYIKRTVEK